MIATSRGYVSPCCSSSFRREGRSKRSPMRGALARPGRVGHARAMTDGSTPEVLVQDHGAVRLIRLQRPSAKNALTPEVVDTLSSRFSEAGADAAVRTIVLSGVPGAFCSGADVRIIAQELETGGDGVRRVL